MVDRTAPPPPPSKDRDPGIEMGGASPKWMAFLIMSIIVLGIIFLLAINGAI
jgi:hypothetical protein